MAKGNGIEKRGKSKATVKADGEHVGIQKGGKGTAGVKNIDLKTMGRGLAKVKNQKGG